MYRVFVERADHSRADIASFETEEAAKLKAVHLCDEIDDSEEHYFQGGTVCVERPDGTRTQYLADGEWEEILA
jgi:hypothetical protein